MAARSRFLPMLPSRTRRRASLVLPFFALLLCLGCSNRATYYYETLPPAADVGDVERIAVADFQGLERSGRIIGSKIAEGIVDAGYYRLYERSELDRILDEKEFNQSEWVDPATVSDLKLAGVDALIFGVVDAYNIDSQTGVEKVEREVKSGRTRKVEREGKNGEIEIVEEDILETILVERPYTLREGTLAVTFRLANINSGQIVAIKTETASFSQRRWHDEARRLPNKDEILEGLAESVCDRFLGQIHPRTVAYRVEFEENEAPATELGISYARNGLWEEAQRAFRQAAHAYPNDASAQYNFALAANVLGNEFEAEQAVQKAIHLDPQDKYMRLLASIRQGDWAR